MSSPSPSSNCWKDDPFPVMISNDILPCGWHQWATLGGILCFFIILIFIFMSGGGEGGGGGEEIIVVK